MEKDDIISRVGKSTGFSALGAALSDADVSKIRIGGFTGSWINVCLARFNAAGGKGFLLVCPDRESAGYAYGDMQYLLGDGRVLFYPASYRRAYQVEEIDNANVLLRGEALSSLASPEGASLCVVTYPDALFEKVMGRRSIDGSTFRISVGDNTGMEQFIDRLEAAGFERSDFVFSAGQYSVRRYSGCFFVQCGAAFPIGVFRRYGREYTSVRYRNPAIFRFGEVRIGTFQCRGQIERRKTREFFRFPALRYDGCHPQRVFVPRYYRKTVGKSIKGI